jgi:uncharacterized protein (DUF1778 family)
MTTKERLHEIVDELSELEASDALRVLEAHRAGGWWAQEPQRIELTAEDAGRLVDVFDNSGRSQAGLHKLVERADAHDEP